MNPAAEARKGLDGLIAEATRLLRCAKQRDHVIATIITNLRHGVPAADVLAWWDSEGRQMLDSEGRGEGERTP